MSRADTSSGSTFRPKRTAASRGTLLGLLVLALVGCSAVTEETAFALPGKYDLFACSDLARAANSTRQREQELQQLMTRAEQGPAGTLVNAMAYRTDHMRARADLKLLADTAAKKNCPSDSLWTSERSLF
jgi:hypothetical protein